MAASTKNKGAAKRRTNKPKSTKPGQKPPHITPAERVRLGPDVAAIKGAVKPSQWRQMVKDAHSRQQTMAGYLSDAPGPLKERTRKSLETEAMGQAQTAYAPGFAELDRETSRAANIRDKRTQDQALYDQWLMQKTAETTAQAQAAQQRYENLATSATSAQEAAAAAQKTDIDRQMANSGPSDMSNSVYLRAAAERAQGSVEKARSQAQQVYRAGPETALRSSALTQSAIGQGRAARAEIQGEYGKTTEEIRKTRAGLISDRAKTAVSRWTALLDQEVTKANANRDFQGLMSQLDVKKAEQQQEDVQFRLGLKAKTKIANQQAATTRQGQRTAAETSRQNNAATNEQRRADRAQRSADKAADRRQRGELNTKEDAKNSEKQVETIRHVASLIGGQRNGMIRDPRDGKWKGTRAVLRANGYSDDVINVAVQVHGGKLNSRGIRRAKILGIPDASALL